MADVAVVGAGIVGAAVARELAVRGVSVVLVDRAGISEGTTGLGEGNVLCCDKLPGPELELALHGLAVYDEIEERIGAVAAIRRKGALLVHTDAGTWAAEPERLARMGGVEAGLLTPDQVREIEPELDGPIHGASRFPRDLQCDPAAIARALAAEAAAADAQVRTGCAVERIVMSGGRVSGVDTADGPIACGAVVVAAGTWSAMLAGTAGLPLPVEPRKGQLVLLRAPRAGFVRHKVVEASYLAAVGSAGADLRVSTVIETTVDGDVLVGSSRERRGFDVEPDPAVSDALVERAARLFGAVRGFERAGTWAGLRPWLPDHLPAIGASRAVPGLWVATGHEGAGVALGPVTGRVLAQAYCGEPALVDLSPFDPDRFA
jgi:glycine/D-amino acid oxidase-like deaminating enzyme